MYKLLRNLHLGAGLFSAVFLFAYGLSAAQMAYPILRPHATETVTTIEVPEDVDASPRALARWLMERHHLRGDLIQVTDNTTSVTLTIARLGTTQRVEYDRRTRAAHVTTRVADALGMLNRIHHIRGVGHDYWAMDAWGWFLLLVSIALLLQTGTGVVMWFQRHRERRLGGVVLGAGLVWGVTLLILIRVA